MRPAKTTAVSSQERQRRHIEGDSVPWIDSNYDGIVSHDTSCKFQDLRWPIASRHGMINAVVNFDRLFIINGVEIRLLDFPRFVWSIKCYILARMRPRAKTNRNAAPSTVVKEWMELCVLIRWMLSEHDSTMFSFFNNQTAVDDWVAYAKSVAKSPHHLTRLLTPIQNLFDERERMPTHDRVKMDPYGGVSVHELACYRQYDHSKPFVRLPDDVAQHIISACLKLLYEDAVNIIDVLIKRGAALNATKRMRLPIYTARHRARMRIWKPGDIEVANRFIQPFDVAGREICSFPDLLNLEIDLRIACVTVIACFAGPRIGEILALRPGCLTGPTLSEDGTLEIYWLTGQIYKNAPGHGQGASHVWVAGARPAGSHDRVPVQKAVEVLELLHRTTQPDSPTLLFGLSNRAPGHSHHSLDKALRRIASAPCVSKWHFHSMQFRKTCAHYLSRRHRRGVDLVAELFGHSTLAASLGYVGTDVDFNTEVGKEASDLAAADLLEMANSGAITGPAGERVRGPLLEFRGMFASEAKFVRIVADAVKDGAVKIFPAEWGACFYHAKNSQCGGSIGGPNYAYRTPEKCMQCENLAVSEVHRPYHAWRINQFVAMRNAYPEAAAFQVEEWTTKIQSSQRYIDSLDAQKQTPS